MDEARIVTDSLPSDEMQLVQELVPSTGRYGEVKVTVKASVKASVKPFTTHLQAIPPVASRVFIFYFGQSLLIKNRLAELEKETDLCITLAHDGLTVGPWHS